MPRTAPTLSLLLVACAAAPPQPAALQHLRGNAPLVHELPDGARVRLLPVGGTLPQGAVAGTFDGLWREALRQSTRFDIAAGPVADAGDAEWQLALTIDAAAATCTATLRHGDGGEHLAAVPLAMPWSRALDELALRARLALGDPVAESPVPTGLAYSDDATVVAQCELGIEQARDGEFAAAWQRLAALRPRDGGSPFLLETMAAVAALRGQPGDAVAIATEALTLRGRLAPVTQHRLLRTLLLARASRDPQQARRCDDDLLTLAEVAGRERPHDPEVRVTRGIALNFLGRFAEARAELQPLVQRLPRSSSVRYHLGWAELALGDPRAASGHFAAVAPVLPLGALIVPRALARYEAGEHEQLRAWLRELVQDRALAEGEGLHQVRRLQAAHELLTGHPDAAVDQLLHDVAWLLEQPSRLHERAGEFAETGEVLVRLGAGERLRPALVTLQHLQTDPLLADAVAFLTAMADTAQRRHFDDAVATGLEQRGATVWAHVLRAYGHDVQGELGAERAALAQAAQESSSPLVKASLLRNMRRSGQLAEATALRQALHREMQTIDLRRRSQHPLLAPELALAWLAE